MPFRIVLCYNRDMKTTRFYNIGSQQEQIAAPTLLSFNRVDGYEEQTSPHSHPYMEIFYFLDGAGKIELNDKSVSFGASDMLVVGAGRIHSLVSLGAKPLSFYSLLLDSTKLSGEVLHAQSGKQTGERFALLSTELTEKKNGFALAVNGVAQLLFADVLRLTSPAAPSPSTAKVSRTASQAKAIIDVSFAEPLRLNDLAKAVFVNRYSLVHAFQKAYRTTPMQYLNAVRINRAKTLLCESDESITEIARAVGFDNPVYFAEQFKKTVGTTPSVFRKIHRLG